MNQLFWKGALDTFTLDEDQVKRFHDIIEHIINPPLLALPEPNLSYSVDCATCAYVIGR